MWRLGRHGLVIFVIFLCFIIFVLILFSTPETYYCMNGYPRIRGSVRVFSSSLSHFAWSLGQLIVI